MKKIPIPKISGEISHKELHKLLKKKLPHSFLKDVVIYLVDKKYQLTTREEIERFLAFDKTDLVKYFPEYHDCDDFSFRLMGQISIPEWSGLAFGICFSGIHAYNIFCDGKNIFCIEPQSDKVWQIPDEIPKKYKKYYLPIRFVMM